jgi:hypothetical protein
MTQAPVRSLQASVEVKASPQQVWDVVADLRRTPEWSPECRRVVPLRDWLVGFNRRGRVVWATLSRVTRRDAGREIAWRVLTNRSVWTYRIEATDDGTRLTETRETPEGVAGFASWFTKRLLGGQDVHDSELEAGMASGLERIKALVER